MDVWQRAVDTQRFSPEFRSADWRQRITGGHPERVILTYVGRLGAGALLLMGNLRISWSSFRASLGCHSFREISQVQGFRLGFVILRVYITYAAKCKVSEGGCPRMRWCPNVLTLHPVPRLTQRRT